MAANPAGLMWQLILSKSSLFTRGAREPRMQRLTIEGFQKGTHLHTTPLFALGQVLQNTCMLLPFTLVPIVPPLFN
jgi:hypothetical protein